MMASVWNHIRNLAIILSLSVPVSCTGTDDGKLENPFGEGGTAPVEAGYTSHADTVFLSWKLVKDVDFTSWLVTDQYGRNSVALSKDVTECVLTHIPYNQNVTVSVSLMSGDKEVESADIAVKIDGYDRYIASKIIPDSGSVTEGDGMYSIDLQDGRSIFLMGDSYTGTVSGGKRVDGNHMYRNTYSIYDHKTETSRPICEMNGKNTSAIVPEGIKDEGKKWYWPGHGFVVGDRLYIFQFLMHAGDGPAGWNFYYDATDIIQYSLPEVDVKPVKVGRIPFNDTPPLVPSPETPLIHFGAVALNDIESTGYLYIYAQTDIENDLDPVTEVYVARTTEENLYSQWEFYNGSTWVKDGKACKALSGLETVPVSSQFNVFKLDGKYVLIAQNKAWNSGEIYTLTSDNPWGPWSNKTLIYKIPDLGNPNWYTYNAMAHPQFEKDGMILVSFNVNTQVFAEQSSNVESYRPKFFWVEKDMILN